MGELSQPRARHARTRLNPRFSASGDRAACLVNDDSGVLRVESWSLDGGPPPRTLATAVGETIGSQPVPAEDGRVVVVRTRTGAHDVAVLAADGERTVERHLGTFDCRGLRAVPSQDGSALAWLVAYHTSDRTTIHRIDRDASRIDDVLEMPGRIVGEGWLSEDGAVLAANHVLAGQRRIAALDLCAGTVTPLLSGAGLLLTSPRRGAALVLVKTGEGIRLGWSSPAGADIRYADALRDLTGEVLPLAVDPDGERLALRVTAGARSRLFVHDIGGDVAHEVPVPPGVIRSAAWSTAGLRAWFTAPTCPSTVVTIDPRRGVAVGTRDRDGWHDARLERFAGAAGPMEAVVYGDWWRSRHLLVALHGGPQAHWDLGFNPTFQRFAEAGISVVAVNQRGSTGYGAAYRDAIHDAWGGADLADVRRLVRTLTRGRAAGAPRPMLYGVSYGAYLALVAAAADPDRWSRCVAAAPFLSRSRLYLDGPPPVRALLRRTGGDRDFVDDLGRRDLLELYPRITAPVLVVHGERDDVIPVAHSRALAERARALGRPATAFRYREVPDAGHNPLDDAPRGLFAEVVDFLLADRATPARTVAVQEARRA